VGSREAVAMQERTGLVLGTAGHIDHGKTALITALTGTDTDRLPEEKARGITIELGFAALDLPGVGRVAVVVVVAADESVMPQTREHVAICDLLGLDEAVVALTKVDLADEELVELAAEEVHDLLAPTRLAGAPVIGVSARTGEGLDALRDALAEAARAARPHTTRSGPPRLAIDRAFAMRGFGAVVTGTLVGAPLREGDAVEVLPSGRRARVRGLQSHGETLDAVLPGSRCAANLQGVDVADLRRGDVVTRPESLRITRVADVEVAWLASAAPAEGIVSVELLAGTAERRARLAPIGVGGFRPGGRAFARIHVDGDPLPWLPGDRFIVRGFARTGMAGATLGGGVVLDVAPPRRRRSDPALSRELTVLASGDLAAGLRVRVRRAGYTGADDRTLARETGRDEAGIVDALEGLGRDGDVARAGPHVWVDADALGRLRAVLEESVTAFHAAEPLRPGMPRAALRGRLPENVPAEIAECAIAGLEASGVLERDGEQVRRAGHRPSLDADAEAAVARIVADARAAGLEPPGPREWAERIGVPLERFRDWVAHLERTGVLVRAPGDLWFDREAVEALRARVVEHLERHGSIDTQSYKALIGTSRRAAMPLMELFDELHVTRRQGDVRVLRKG
jgi:selenocysteine-specific elongation factor